MADLAPHELSAGELGAWRGLLRAHAALVKALDAELEAECGIPLTSYEVLLHLAKAPEGKLRMAELADRALLSRSGMTRLVDRLEREGYLRRSTCVDDKRGAFAVLTPEGADMLARSRQTHLAGVRRRFFDHFSEEELAQMAGYFERIDLSLSD